MIIKTKLVGVSYNNRQKNIVLLRAGQALFWKHESENPFDSNSILVYADVGLTVEVGHLRRELAAEFVERMGRGMVQRLFVDQVTGGGEKQSLGVNVRVIVDEAL